MQVCRAQGDRCAERTADAGMQRGREESCSIGLLAAVHGLSEGSAGQKCSPALVGSRALDQSVPKPERCLLLLHGKAFARRPAAPHDRL